MTERQAYTADRLHNGEEFISGAVVVANGRIETMLAREDIPEDCPVTDLGEGILTPGFVDLQVNGGGGVMFNSDRSVAALRKIIAAHATTGTAAILPTLITDIPKHVTEAIAAAKQALAEGVPGIAGLHLEGPHLSVARKGAHDPTLIRPMSNDDLDELCEAARSLPNLMLTVAPETVTPAQISTLVTAGAIVSIGHTDADIDTCRAAIDAGANCATHLFNAMSPLTHRAPGVVGAVLDSRSIHAGLIADGIHVHPASIATALRAKRGPGEVFLVTDAMSTVGSDITEFTLNGRRILRRDGRLTIEDGTLAGADLTMPQAISVLVNQAGTDLSTAIRMATGGPARVLRESGGLGRLAPGSPARMAHLHADLSCTPIAA